jgi:hypothetical protein
LPLRELSDSVYIIVEVFDPAPIPASYRRWMSAQALFLTRRSSPSDARRHHAETP